MVNNKLKVCSFYVSDWHLTAMLLPFIEEKTEKGETINTILEKNLTHNIKEILTRIQIDEQKKEQILKIDWKNKCLIKFGEIRKFMERATKNQKNVTIIIESNKDKIEYINKNIDKWIDRNERKVKRKEIKIINCYEVTEFNENLQEILDKHDKILNTSGIHEIEEMYSEYVKKQA